MVSLSPQINTFDGFNVLKGDMEYVVGTFISRQEEIEKEYAFLGEKIRDVLNRVLDYRKYLNRDGINIAANFVLGDMSEDLTLLKKAITPLQYGLAIDKNLMEGIAKRIEKTVGLLVVFENKEKSNIDDEEEDDGVVAFSDLPPKRMPINDDLKTPNVVAVEGGSSNGATRMVKVVVPVAIRF